MSRTPDEHAVRQQMLNDKTARQATLDFGDKESPTESSNVVRCRQLTSLKNIGSFHAFTTGR
jgi:hypothetical protein